MTEPLVLLPGMGCDARVFSHQITELSRDMVVNVAPITLGETIETMASSLIPMLPQKFALAGLSMGGIVAMELLRRIPDRITRIALMDTNALAETPQSAAALEPVIVAARTGHLDEAFDAFMKPDYLAPGPARQPALELMRQMVKDNGAETLVRQARALQRRHDQQGSLRRCKLPGLVLCGAEDRLTPPRRHQFMAELMRFAKLRVIEGAGHLPTLEKPEVTTDALRAWMGQPLVLK